MSRMFEFFEAETMSSIGRVGLVSKSFYYKHIFVSLSSELMLKPLRPKVSVFH